MEADDLPQTCCALCREPAELLDSHILPAFVIRWVKETSITGKLRANTNPMKRAQDGLKVPLLCEACERRLNRWETEFAKRVFHPCSTHEQPEVRYGDWMLRFCVSVSWRLLKFDQLSTGLRAWSQHRVEAEQALERWAAFLLGRSAHPGPYEQHLLWFVPITGSSIRELPTNINRYLLRTIEMDTASAGETSAITFAKMAHLAVVGVVVPPRRRWRGARIATSTGVIRPSEFDQPVMIDLVDYLMARARRGRAVTDAVPEDQADRIEADFMRDPERVARTPQFEAMLLDKQLFGEEAIVRNRTPQGR